MAQAMMSEPVLGGVMLPWLATVEAFRGGRGALKIPVGFLTSSLQMGGLLLAGGKSRMPADVEEPAGLEGEGGLGFLGAWAGGLGACRKGAK